MTTDHNHGDTNDLAHLAVHLAKSGTSRAAARIILRLRNDNMADVGAERDAMAVYAVTISD